jgi:hypothetical protein
VRHREEQRQRAVPPTGSRVPGSRPTSSGTLEVHAHPAGSLVRHLLRRRERLRSSRQPTSASPPAPSRKSRWEATLPRERGENPLGVVGTLGMELPNEAAVRRDHGRLQHHRTRSKFSSNRDRAFAVIRSALMQDNRCAVPDGIAQGLAASQRRSLQLSSAICATTHSRPSAGGTSRQVARSPPFDCYSRGGTAGLRRASSRETRLAAY